MPQVVLNNGRFKQINIRLTFFLEDVKKEFGATPNTSL